METNPWTSGGLPLLNIAMVTAVRESLGPGDRVVLWVQGCRNVCPGCISPEWRSLIPAKFISPEALAQVVDSYGLSGLTLSGGEPMLQAAGLAAMIRLLRCNMELSVICFTGYRIEDLHHSPPGPGVLELLAETDLLIDSPYLAELNDNKGLRGSSNQRLLPLTNRLVGHVEHLGSRERMVEIIIEEDGAILAGVPPAGVVNTFHAFVEQANRLNSRRIASIS